jgi:hypothetical protein
MDTIAVTEGLFTIGIVIAMLSIVLIVVVIALIVAR